MALGEDQDQEYEAHAERAAHNHVRKEPGEIGS